MVKSSQNQQIGYILRSYPRLSQTFILNEILALEKLQVPIQIFALTNPQEEIVQPQVRQIRAPVHYLSQAASKQAFWAGLPVHTRVLLKHPFGYLRALVYALRKREIDQGYATSSRMQCFLQAVSFSRILDRADPPIGHLHAHFAHDPTLIAQLAHLITGITYSFTAHARDLYQIPRSALVDRIHSASAVVTCCQNNLRYLVESAPAERAKFSMIYHGVNLQSFQPVTAVGPEAGPVALPVTGARPETGLPLILSIGRLVEKKGFFDLLEALQRVKAQGHAFRCKIYGDGPLEPALAAWISEHGLADCVSLAGSVTQQELIGIFQSATLFALTPSVTDDGDRDGIPNVLVEAMAVGLPVISTATAGIPELMTHNLDGLLYPPHDIDGISAGIISLLEDGSKRARLGKAARARVSEHFDLARSAGQLKERLYQTLSPSELAELARASRLA